MRLFYDFNPDGGLCHILAAMFKYKNEQGWRRFDLQSPSRKDVNLLMCKKVEEELKENELYQPPVVYVKPNVKESDRERVRGNILMLNVDS